MKIKNTFIKNNYKTFSGIEKFNDKYMAQKELSNDDIEYFVHSINSILSAPINERSNHLMHEYNPKTGKPILGKFKLKANDGSIITVSRSITKKGSDDIKYLAITIEKKHSKNTIRIDLSNNKVIKSGLEKSFFYDEKLQYYSNAELNKIPSLKKILSYFPEITKIQNDKPKRSIKKATIKNLRSPISLEKYNLNVNALQERENNIKQNGFTPFSPIRLLESPLIMPRQSIETSMNKLSCMKKIKQNPDIISIGKAEKIEYIEKILNKYLRFKKTMSKSQRLAFINSEAMSYIDKTYGSNVSITLKNFDGDKKARFTIMPINDLFRILILDKDKKILRGYMIKDKDKLVQNFNIKAPNVIPGVFLFSHNGSQSEEYIKTLRQDIDELADKMHSVDLILDKFINN